MKLEFDYTFEDVKEAYAAHQPEPAKGRASAARTVGAVFFGIMIFLTFALLVWDTDAPPARPIWLDMAMPAIALVLFVTPWLTYRSLKVSGVRGVWRTRGFLVAVGWLLAVGLLLILWRMLGTPPATDAMTAAAHQGLTWGAIRDFLIPHITWLLLIGAIFVLLVRQTRQQLLATWNGSPTLHRRHTLTLAVKGRAIRAVAAGDLSVNFELPEPVSGRTGAWTKRDSVTAFRAWQATQ